MSDQSFDQSFGQSPNQSAATPVKGARRKGSLGVGLLLLLGGVGGGAALLATSTSQYKEAVTKLQRGPVGCETDLDFTGTGTFTMYIETKGKIGSLHGDCENTDTQYNRAASGGPPVVAITLTDADGNRVRLARANGASYDAGGYVGTSIRSVVIDKPAQYTLSVESDDTDFAVSIGRDPKSDFDKLKLIAMGAAGAGLIIGGLLILLGLRRRPATITMGPFTSGAVLSSATQDPDDRLAPPSWAPSEPTAPQPMAPSPWEPQPESPQPPVSPPPPPWQPPHVEGGAASWSAPQQ